VKKYDELLNRTDGPAGSSWGLWGNDNDLGTLNFITSETVLGGAACVRTGDRINLDLPFPTQHPANGDEVKGRRSPAVHHIAKFAPVFYDDYLDGFYLQGGSQIDALRHAAHPAYGLYNGVAESEIVACGPRLGINLMADAGIVGRGVLLDIAQFMADRGRAYDPTRPEAITVELLEEVRDAHNIEFRSGDILLVRTGVQQVRGKNLPTSGEPGLKQSQEMIAWLWDHQFSMIAADNSSVEMFPPATDSPFQAKTEEGRVWHTVDGIRVDLSALMHPSLIGLLGFAIGENLALDELAAKCAADGLYYALVVVKPLNIVGGAGSPSNAVAIR
jgi:kynurenine formamidase